MSKTTSKILLFIISALTILQLLTPVTVKASSQYVDSVKQGKEDDFGVAYDYDSKSNNGGVIRGGAYMDEEGKTGVWNKIFSEYKGVIVGITGIGTLTMVCLFIFNFMKLGQSAGNPQQRQVALTGLLWTGLAAAGLGGVTLFVGFSSSLLKS